MLAAFVATLPTVVFPNYSNQLELPVTSLVLHVVGCIQWIISKCFPLKSTTNFVFDTLAIT